MDAYFSKTDARIPKATVQTANQNSSVNGKYYELALIMIIAKIIITNIIIHTEMMIVYNSDCSVLEALCIY